MNLVELFIKSDPIIQFQKLSESKEIWECVERTSRAIAKISIPQFSFATFPPRFIKDTYRGFALRAGERIVVINAGNFWENYASGSGVGHFKSLSPGRNVKIKLGWMDKCGVTVISDEIVVGKNIKTFYFPKCHLHDASLVIELNGEPGDKCFYGVHKVLSRDSVKKLCRGVGVEIGPGANPQILPRKNLLIKYIEQATPDEWNTLYGKDLSYKVDKKLWSHYAVGNADNLGFNNNSLDFIFSSHVFEHLANPFGHLQYWQSLLKKNGFVVAIIPDKSGCKDYPFPSSSYQELSEEFLDKIMEPTIKHYDRWNKVRKLANAPEVLMDLKRSIHVHFYTPKSMGDILKKKAKSLGFKDFKIFSEENHKDFYVVLRK